MFDFIRNNRRFLQFVLLVMILPSFVFFGIQGYSRLGSGEELASIGSQQVNQTEVDNGMRDQIDRLRQQFGGQVDATVFDTPEARSAMLERLINQKVLSAEVTRANLSASDSKVWDILATIPGVMNNGKLDEEALKRFAAGQQLSAVGFVAKLRRDIETQQAVSAVTGSASASPTFISQLVDLQGRSYTVQTLPVLPQAYAAKATVSPEAVKAFYEANKKQFEVPERAKIEYVVFDVAALAQTLTVSAEEIKSYYEQNKGRFGTPEERRASHILIKADKSAPAAEVEAAKAKALAIEAKLRKVPSQFAKLAAENSDDPGSKAQGGDLPFFKREAMVKPFSDAAFAMKDGEISAPVRSDFGWHIIKLTGVKAANPKSLAEVSKELETELKQQLASKRFPEQSEVFSTMVYESGNNFKSVAEKYKLTVKTAEGLTREAMKAPKQAGADSPFNEALANALFAEDSIQHRKNTQATGVGNSRLVSARLMEYTANKTLAFEEVKATVQGQVLQAELIKLAVADGQTKLKALQANPSDSSVLTTGLEAAKTVSRGKPENLPPAALKAIFKVDTAKLPAWTGAELPNGQFALYKVTGITASAPADEAARKQMEQGVRKAYGDAELQAMIATMRERQGAKVVKKPSPASNKAG